MKGEDIKAGSNLILSNRRGRIAPAVAAKVVINIKLIPTAEAIKGPSPCHQAKGILLASLKRLKEHLLLTP